MPIKVTRKTPPPAQELPIEKIEVVCRLYAEDSISVTTNDDGDEIVFQASWAKGDGSVLLSKVDAIEFANELIKFAEQK